MFDCLSLLAKHASRRGPVGGQDFRKLDTERGSYIVEWQPGSINALLRQEGLSARDIRVSEPRELQRLIRDLLLLGLQDEFETCRRSPITRLAQALMRRKHHMGATRPADQATLTGTRSVVPG
jgi:hypothetical protein